MRADPANRRTARGNRAGLTVVGVVLILVAAAALARGLGLAPSVLGGQDQPWWDQLARDLAAQGWFGPVVAVALLLVALLALRWLLVQTRSDTLHTVRLEPDSRRGHTSLPARAVTEAVADDLTENSRLRRTRAVLSGRPGRPRLHLSVAAPAEADPVEVRSGLRAALTRHRQALDLGDLPVTVVLR